MAVGDLAVQDRQPDWMFIQSEPAVGDLVVQDRQPNWMFIQSEPAVGDLAVPMSNDCLKRQESPSQLEC